MITMHFIHSWTDGQLQIQRHCDGPVLIIDFFSDNVPLKIFFPRLNVLHLNAIRG